MAVVAAARGKLARGTPGADLVLFSIGARGTGSVHCDLESWTGVVGDAVESAAASGAACAAAAPAVPATTCCAESVAASCLLACP